MTYSTAISNIKIVILDECDLYVLMLKRHLEIYNGILFITL